MARTDLRAAREEAETEVRLRLVAEEQASSLKSELAQQKTILEEEKEALENSLRTYQKNLEDTRAQNTLLHGQLEKIGDQIEKIQSVRAAEAAEGTASEELVSDNAMQKTVSELREVVKFVRSEKEMIQAQLDTERRAAERERAASAVAKRSLDEARAELKVLQENSQRSVVGDTNVEELQLKLQEAQEQTRLLGDSNSHLREELGKVKKSTSDLNAQLELAKKNAEPAEKRQHELEAEKAGLVAEKESLLREVSDWKGRVQSLVSKFNQVSFLIFSK